MLFAAPALRSREAVTGNRLGQSGLWPRAISGDLPIVVARIADQHKLNLARDLLTAQWYWRRCGLVADVILLNNANPVDVLRARLEEPIRLGPSADLAGKPGGMFLLDSVTLPATDVMLLEAAARAILRGKAGSLNDQMDPVMTSATWPAALTVARDVAAAPESPEQAVGRPRAVVVFKRAGWVCVEWAGVQS